MNNDDPVNVFLSRADNLAVALDVKRALEKMNENGPDSLEPSIAKLLREPSNERLARAIEQRVDPIKDELLQSFGPVLKQKLHHKLQADGFGDTWELRLAFHEPWTKPYAGLGFFPVGGDRTGGAPFLYVCIQRTENYMNFGISRSEDRRTRPELWDVPEITALESQLSNRGYKKGTWWLGYKDLYNLQEDEIYLAISGAEQRLINDIVDMFWRMFEDTKQTMEQINLKLIEAG